MKKYCLLVLMAVGLIPTANAATKCEANIGGFHFNKLYVMGTHYNGVVWAYKHLSEQSCFTPVTDITKADAILEVVNPTATNHLEEGKGAASSLSVTCRSTASSTSCLDSDGNELSVSCSGDVCSSYYGPSGAAALANAIGDLIHAGQDAISNASYQGEARIYTLDHKLLWKSELQKGSMVKQTYLWSDKLHTGDLTPPCKLPGTWGWSKYKSYRHWAETTCGLEFDPLVSIDIKAQARQNTANSKQPEQDEMRKNALDAAEKQRKAVVE